MTLKSIFFFCRFWFNLFSKIINKLSLSSLNMDNLKERRHLRENIFFCVFPLYILKLNCFYFMLLLTNRFKCLNIAFYVYHCVKMVKNLGGGEIKRNRDTYMFIINFLLWSSNKHFFYFCLLSVTAKSM